MRIALSLPAATLVLVFCGTVSAIAASSPRDALVVSVSWLAQHLNDPDLVILHVGDKAEYEATHIPGARFVALQDISVSDRTGMSNGLTLEMPSSEDLREGLAALGISDNSRIVVYFAKDWVSPTTRVMFTLDYAGLGSRASLLDGGQLAWARDGRPVSSTVPEIKVGTLSPLRLRPIVVLADFVRQNAKAPGYALVDARDRRFYDGTQSGSRQAPPRLGHIPGAVSFPFSETTDDRLSLRPAAALEARFKEAGVKPGDTIVAYCHIGQQATAVLFAARTLGRNVLLYDGSFEDWAKHKDYQVVNPSTAAPAPVVKEP